MVLADQSQPLERESLQLLIGDKKLISIVKELNQSRYAASSNPHIKALAALCSPPPPKVKDLTQRVNSTGLFTGRYL